MKKIDIDVQMITKIAGGMFTVLGIGLLAGDGLYQKNRNTIEVLENDIYVEDPDEVAKETSD